MRSRAEPKRRRCALCTGTLCSKAMIGGGLARQLGWHARTPRTAHLCHHFPHGLRRCGVVGSRSLRRSVLFGDGEAGSRQRRGFSRCDKVETVWQAHEMRQAAGHGVVSRQAGRDCRRRRTHGDAISGQDLHNFFTHRSVEIASLRPTASCQFF